MKHKLEKKDIVGFTVTGGALTKRDYNLRLKKAEQQIASGDFITQENLEIEIENWDSLKSPKKNKQR